MKVQNVKTISQAQQFCEGVINDFESGIATKEETLQHLKEYTFQLHDVFFEVAKRNVAKNPKYFETASNRTLR